MVGLFDSIYKARRFAKKEGYELVLLTDEHDVIRINLDGWLYETRLIIADVMGRCRGIVVEGVKV